MGQSDRQFIIRFSTLLCLHLFVFPRIFLVTTLTLRWHNFHPVAVQFFDQPCLGFDFHHRRTIRIISFLSQSFQKTGFSFKQLGPPSKLHWEQNSAPFYWLRLPMCGLWSGGVESSNGSGGTDFETTTTTPTGYGVGGSGGALHTWHCHGLYSATRGRDRLRSRFSCQNIWEDVKKYHSKRI